MIDEIYHHLAPKYTYNPDSGTLMSYRRVPLRRASGDEATEFSRTRARRASKAKPQRVTFPSIKYRTPSGKAYNLSVPKLCFLKAYGWLPDRVYLINGDRTDWRASNLSEIPPIGDVTLGVEITESSNQGEQPFTETPNDLFSNIVIKESNND